MRKARTPKRKIPILRISLLTNEDYTKICDVPEFKNIIMDETLIAIKDAIKKNKDYIELFEISDSKKYIGFERKEWKGPLNKAMSYFAEEVGDLDKAIECRELIKQI